MEIEEEGTSFSPSNSESSQIVASEDNNSENNPSSAQNPASARPTTTRGRVAPKIPKNARPHNSSQSDLILPPPIITTTITTTARPSVSPYGVERSPTSGSPTSFSPTNAGAFASLTNFISVPNSPISTSSIASSPSPNNNNIIPETTELGGATSDEFLTPYQQVMKDKLKAAPKTTPGDLLQKNPKKRPRSGASPTTAAPNQQQTNQQEVTASQSQDVEGNNPFTAAWTAPTPAEASSSRSRRIPTPVAASSSKTPTSTTKSHEKAVSKVKTAFLRSSRLPLVNLSEFKATFLDLLKQEDEYLQEEQEKLEEAHNYIKKKKELQKQNENASSKQQNQMEIEQERSVPQQCEIDLLEHEPLLASTSNSTTTTTISNQNTTTTTTSSNPITTTATISDQNTTTTTTILNPITTTTTISDQNTTTTTSSNPITTTTESSNPITTITSSNEIATATSSDPITTTTTTPNETTTASTSSNETTANLNPTTTSNQNVIEIDEDDFKAFEEMDPENEFGENGGIASFIFKKENADILDCSELAVKDKFDLIEESIAKEVKKLEKLKNLNDKDSSNDILQLIMDAGIEEKNIMTAEQAEKMLQSNLYSLTEAGRKGIATLLPRKELNYITEKMQKKIQQLKISNLQNSQIPTTTTTTTTTLPQVAVIPTLVPQVPGLPTNIQTPTNQQISEIPELPEPIMNINAEIPQHLELVINVAIYHPEKNIKVEEFAVLGSQKLCDLKDVIYCLNDNINELKKSNSSYFFIENVFYNDFRDKNAIDYSKNVIEWLNVKDSRWKKYGNSKPISKKMEETKFEDLSIRIGEKYLYCHQGNCKHFIIFTNAHLIDTQNAPKNSLFSIINSQISNQNSQNSSGPQKTSNLNLIGDRKFYFDYPLKLFQSKIRTRKCSICDIYATKYVTYKDKYTSDEPTFFCERCYKQFHYDANGKLLYTDFEVYNYYHE